MNNAGDGGCIDGLDGFNLDVDPALAAFLERCAPMQDATVALVGASVTFFRHAMLQYLKATMLLTSLINFLLQKKIPYHQRRREEIQSLREEVNVLSKKLEHQKTVSELQQGTSRLVAMKHDTSEPTREEGLWKYIARSEQQYLQKSMDEHEALRQLVDSKQQEIENMQRVLKGQLQDSMTIISLEPNAEL